MIAWKKKCEPLGHSMYERGRYFRRSTTCLSCFASHGTTFLKTHLELSFDHQARLASN
jgi:hypothetical protein